uniref:Protein disulfide-isomerase n=1 Tax=Panagrolaimus superbus TaxID=310955 RepID=A0A914Y7G4_9BILA
MFDCRSLGLLINTFAFDSSEHNVIELTAKSFKKQVLESEHNWIIQFYSPWCKHCVNFIPEYKNAAKALKGITKVGAVDMSKYQSVGAPYSIQGVPTIMIFGNDKKKPIEFNGARTSESLVIAALEKDSSQIEKKHFSPIFA